MIFRLKIPAPGNGLANGGEADQLVVAPALQHGAKAVLLRDDVDALVGSTRLRPEKICVAREFDDLGGFTHQLDRIAEALPPLVVR